VKPILRRCTIREDFGKLLECGQFCDVNFVVGGNLNDFASSWQNGNGNNSNNEVTISAHASIVAARSERLQEKLRVS
jgi:hypothetical protein